MSKDRNTLSKLEKDAKDFESILTDENKKIIETILDSIIISRSKLSVSSQRDALDILLGKKNVSFLVGVVSHPQDIENFNEIKTISNETKKYLIYLNAKYLPKLSGVLNYERFNEPDSWVSALTRNTKLDYNINQFYISLEINKANGECIVIEDDINSLVGLVSAIIESINEESSDMIKIRKNIGIQKRSLERLNKAVNELLKLQSQ